MSTFLKINYIRYCIKISLNRKIIKKYYVMKIRYEYDILI